MSIKNIIEHAHILEKQIALGEDVKENLLSFAKTLDKSLKIVLTENNIEDSFYFGSNQSTMELCINQSKDEIYDSDHWIKDNGMQDNLLGFE